MAESRTPSASAQVWGLTGGIASGKSTAARIFAEKGFAVLDADAIARALTDPGGAAEAQVRAEFGTTDRARLREIVFADPARRARLEAILHPLIRAESERRIAELAPGSRASVVIYEAALLVETGRYRDFAGLIVVDAPRPTRKQRLIARNGFTDKLAEKILSSQSSDDQRLAAATAVLDNSRDEHSLRAQIDALIAARGW